MNTKQALRISRIHLPVLSSTVDDTLTISGEKAHYLRNVLRIKKGHQLVFFTHDGVEYHAEVSEIQRHDVFISNIKQNKNPTQPSTINATIIQGISSGDRMDYTVQKSAELGASVLIPVLTTYCSQKIPNNKHQKKQAHWQSVANSACEQSGRCDLLEIKPIARLQDVITAHADNGIFLEPTTPTTLSNLPAKLQKHFSVFIGPEGGFSDEEIKLFQNNGLTGIQLGKRILRTETAAPVILAAFHTLFGDFT
ncbi:16S rRNA (uracil(1498)-N(3))-methyltransferase [Marinicella rhabdoformis]|uniref:16S rRNA (uracil(1498)-N(3))-methyltransferase n=1 Tax=Marinicella rhabdoformis TaxID=2580566 RepID=UPI0012AED1C3|nr:16S rRNA (uracil(1498)-N(3))-methyltransferase [Marinicella rhabdoformis]